MLEFKDYLKLLVKKDGSDLYLIANAPPCGKFQGNLSPLQQETLSDQQIKDIAYNLMSPDQIAAFEQRPEMNLAIAEPGIGRFRINIYKQRNHVAMVIRNIKTDIPTVKDLGLPEVLTKVILSKRGLILFVGGTGSGKSTSLAALIDYRNANSGGHIITIEDPIEFVHPHKRSLISQREVGVDTETFADALKNTLRQAPDVILIGEIRDRETMEHAITFAETGHLAISTLHANNANQTIDRIVNFFEDERRLQLLNDLSLNLRAIISQRLIPTVDGKRTAAIEILLGTPRVAELIKKGEFGEIKEVMEKSANIGMQTFDTSLIKLYEAGKISLEEAIRNADSENNVRLRISLNNKKSGTQANADPKSGFSLVDIEEEKPPEEMPAPKAAPNQPHPGNGAHLIKPAG